MTNPQEAGSDGARMHFGAGAVPSQTPRVAPSSPAARPVKQSQKQRLDAVRQAVRSRQWLVAEGLLPDLLAKGRPSAEALLYMGMVREARMQFAEAAEFAERSIRVQPNPGALLLLARMRRVQGETNEAVALCDRTLKLLPGNAHAAVIKAGAFEEAGRIDEAAAIIEPMIDQAKAEGKEPDPGAENEWAKILVQRKRYAEAIETIDHLLSVMVRDERARCGLQYLRAKACDKAKDYRAAYISGKEANTIGELDFNPEVYEQQVSSLIENWSREKMAKFPVSSCMSEVPIFVAGMPRSGTSLIDQIIDAHPRAAGVGELTTIDNFALQLAQAWNPDLDPPECFGRYDSRKWTQTAEKYVREVEKLAPGAERIVNKSLGNNRLVGLIARLFPKTRIIHAIRDPRDVAISCFMGGFNNAMHPWTTRIEWATRAWDQSMRMMDHWKASLDVPILDVHYERLVNDPGAEFPRIIEFLGLEWDDACREFHKSRRTVRTLSYDQVNRPLYTSSAGRHANYAEFIEGIDFPTYDPFAAA